MPTHSPRRRSSLWVVYFLTFLAPFSTVKAQTTPDLANIYQLAHVHDAQYQQALLSIDADSYQLQATVSGLKPKLSLSGNVTHSHSNITSSANGDDITQSGTSREYALNLSQTVFDVSDLNAYQQGQVGLKALRAELNQIKQEFIIRVSDTYLDTLLAQDDLNLAKRQERTLKKQVTQARERFDVGLVSVTDVLDAQARFDAAQVSTLSAENQLATAQENLLLLTGKPVKRIATLAKDFPIQTPSATVNEWITLATENNPPLQQAIATLEQTRLQKNLAKSAYLPTIDLFSRYGTSMGYQSGFDQPDQRVTSIGVSIEMPLYLGGSIGLAKKESQRRWMAAKHALAATRRTLERDITTLHAQLLTDIRRVKAQNKSVQSNTSALEATEAGYDAGTRSIVYVLLDQQNVFAAERDYAQFRYDYIKRFLRIKQTIGDLHSGTLTEINKWFTDSSPLEHDASDHEDASNHE
ncbi:MAG: TolC family outer membrane protein [Gammaproteobacteria bacterium]